MFQCSSSLQWNRSVCVEQNWGSHSLGQLSFLSLRPIVQGYSCRAALHMQFEVSVILNLFRLKHKIWVVYSDGVTLLYLLDFFFFLPMWMFGKYLVLNESLCGNWLKWLCEVVLMDVYRDTNLIKGCPWSQTVRWALHYSFVLFIILFHMFQFHDSCGFVQNWRVFKFDFGTTF